MADEAGPELAPNGKPFESVWDFPRPPAIERVQWRIRVIHDGITVADAPQALRILETSQPPAYYLDPQYVDLERLRSSDHRTFCEWKGMAAYADVVTPSGVATAAAWTYPSANERYAEAENHWAFYAQALDECWVDEEKVEANPGAFYGGWLTANVLGPVKGAPGTLHW